ncbi:hypothetical protein MS3_00001251 [Schistosoma haematobium]|uniref:Uncharacterized protein n=1 Tax=Schistosoma haematobium TaxID=6185 RepID=A0A922S3V5_SCHHA|nr:hypothetical protein MS3_00001251 [Schistosoma haematobium]KAH9592251.1 hypothetical protein MS3_00001251 [Schistosoma haematobium]
MGVIVLFTRCCNTAPTAFCEASVHRINSVVGSVFRCWSMVALAIMDLAFSNATLASEGNLNIWFFSSLVPDLSFFSKSVNGCSTSAQFGRNRRRKLHVPRKQRSDFTEVGSG